MSGTTGLTLSDEALQVLEVQAQRATIVALKQQALAAKQHGTLDVARAYVQQANTIQQELEQPKKDNTEEEEDVAAPSLATTLPVFWKKVALLCKQAGDLERAKQALRQAKELEAAAATVTGGVSSTSPSAPVVGTSSLPLLPSPSFPSAPPSPVLPPAFPSSLLSSPSLPPSYDENLRMQMRRTHRAPPPLLPPPLPPPPSYDFVQKQNSPNNTTNTIMTTTLPPTQDENEEGMDRGDVRIAEEEEEEGTEERKGELVQPQPPRPPSPQNAVGVVTRTTTTSSVAAATATVAAGVALSYTVNEMMDEEMMTELALLGEVPTSNEYAAKILHYKKLALKFKNEKNDVSKATQYLRSAKQLEHVAKALYSNHNHVDENAPTDGTAGRMTSMLSSCTAEERELLGGLYDPTISNGCGDDGGSTNDGTNTASTSDIDNTKLSIEDLIDMTDDTDVLEFVEMIGTTALPTVEEVSIKIQEHTAAALRHKKEGNLPLAKQELLAAKKTKLVANRLADLYRQLDASNTNTIKNNSTNNNNDGDEEDKEEDDNDDNTKANKNEVGRVTKDPWLSQPSAIIKAEVIRLKNDQKVQEATRVLQLFKQKVHEEQKLQEQQQCNAMITMIQERLRVCTEQIKLWQYYAWFGTEARTVGIPQYQAWLQFQTVCQQAIRTIETTGSEAVLITPRTTTATTTTNDKLYTLDEDLVSLVEACTYENTGKNTTETSLAENTLEVCVLGLFDMHQNEKLQKILIKQHQAYHTKRGSKKKTTAATVLATPPPDGRSVFPPNIAIQAKVQLPIHVEDPSRPVYLDFHPAHTAVRPGTPPSKVLSPASFKYSFDPGRHQHARHSILLPRTDPKHERTLLRRMETKTIQFSIVYAHDQQHTPQAKKAAADALAAAERVQQEAVAAKKKASWFFGGGSKTTTAATTVHEAAASSASLTITKGTEANTTSNKDTFLGKVTIELHPLLSRGCITGDYPIMTNAKSLGGLLRVAIRTRPVLDPERYIGRPLPPPTISIPTPRNDTDDHDHDHTATNAAATAGPSIGVYTQGLSFKFIKQDVVDANKTSIAAIKQESEGSSSSVSLLSSESHTSRSQQQPACESSSQHAAKLPPTTTTVPRAEI